MESSVKMYFMKKMTVIVVLCLAFSSWSQVQNVYDDFEGNGDISTWFGDDCNMDLSFSNPNIQGLNLSSTVLKYTDVGGQYANIRFDVNENFDLSINHTFILKIHRLLLHNYLQVFMMFP